MRSDPLRLRSFLALSVALQACATVTTVNIGSKSSLERQLIGELEPLSEEELLAASVRAQGTIGVGSLDDLQSQALTARRRQIFNRDDVDELKQQGCFGEAKEALLARRSCTLATEDEARAKRLLDEENADRRLIIDWALAADASLTPADRPKVVEVYRRLLLDRAKPGDFIQGDDGTWVQR